MQHTHAPHVCTHVRIYQASTPTADSLLTAPPGHWRFGLALTPMPQRRGGRNQAAKTQKPRQWSTADTHAAGTPLANDEENQSQSGNMRTTFPSETDDTTADMLMLFLED